MANLIDNHWTKFQKGRKKTGGRTKGTKNKISIKVSEALQEAYEGIGGTLALIEFAKDEPAEFFKLWKQIMPTQINADLTSNGNTIGEPTLTPEQALAMMKDFHKKAKSDD